MVIACPPVSPATAAPLAHRVLGSTGKRFSHVFRHGAHRLHHAVHAAATHPHPFVSAACHLTPGALAIVALGTLAPVPPTGATEPPRLPELSTLQQPSPTDPAMAVPGWATPGWAAPPFPASIQGAAGGNQTTSPLADFGPAFAALTPGGDPQSDPGMPNLGPFFDPPPQPGTLPDPPTLTTGSDPTSSAPPSTYGSQPVPEPASLLMFASAACVLGLVATSRRRRRRLPSAAYRPASAVAHNHQD
jgi:hypothetical protein